LELNGAVRQFHRPHKPLIAPAAIDIAKYAAYESRLTIAELKLVRFRDESIETWFACSCSVKILPTFWALFHYISWVGRYDRSHAV